MASVAKKTVVLKNSVDGRTLEVDETAALMSEKIKHMISEGGAIGGGPIVVGDIDGETLAKVMEYCRKHVEIYTLVADKTRRETELKLLGDLFVDVDPSELFLLVTAVYELKIAVLVDLTCERIASMMRGKTAEQIRGTFRIENDFSAEERAEMAKENVWEFHDYSDSS